MARRFNKAIKTPRLKNYRKRAASNCNTTRCANRYIHTLTDNALRRVHGSEAERKRFVKDVKKNLPPTRQTSKFLQKKNIILIMGREAYNDRNLRRNVATPTRAEGSTQERISNARRRLFNDESPVPSPQYNPSPISIDDFLNQAMIVEELIFDPEAAAAAFFNRIEEDEINYVFEEPEEEIIVLTPVESPPAVPIEDEPVADAQFFAADHQPNALYADNQAVQPQAAQFKPDTELEEVLDNHINNIEEAMSPPDYWGHVLLEEE